MPSQTLEDMISTLLAEENRATVGDSKGDSQLETTLYSTSEPVKQG